MNKLDKEFVRLCTIARIQSVTLSLMCLRASTLIATKSMILVGALLERSDK